MTMSTMKDLYLSELRDLYDAETQITQALPKVSEAASSPELKSAFQEHLQQTRGHLDRLDRIFQQLDADPKGKKCKGLAGLVAEGEELLKERIDPDVADAGLIAAAQKIEHYEIAGYGTVCAWAKLLGENDAARLLQQTLDEEAETDKKLSSLAERRINREAAQTR